MAEKSCPISFGGQEFTFPMNQQALTAAMGDPLSELGIPNPLVQIGRVLKIFNPDLIRQEIQGGASDLLAGAEQLASNLAQTAVNVAMARAKQEFDELMEKAEPYLQIAEAVAQGLIAAGDDFGGFASTALCDAAGDFASGFAGSLAIPGILSGDDDEVKKQIYGKLKSMAANQLMTELSGPISDLESGFAFLANGADIENAEAGFIGIGSDLDASFERVGNVLATVKRTVTGVEPSTVGGVSEAIEVGSDVA